MCIMIYLRYISGLLLTTSTASSLFLAYPTNGSRSCNSPFAPIMPQSRYRLTMSRTMARGTYYTTTSIRSTSWLCYNTVMIFTIICIGNINMCYRRNICFCFSCTANSTSIFCFFLCYSALGVLPGQTGRAAWADYKKPSGGRPEGLRG